GGRIAVHPRHHDVAQDDVRGAFATDREARSGIEGDLDAVPVPLEEHLEMHRLGATVFDDEDAFHRFTPHFRTSHAAISAGFRDSSAPPASSVASGIPETA